MQEGKKFEGGFHEEQNVKRYAQWKIKQGDREVDLLAKEAFGEDFLHILKSFAGLW